MTPNQKAALILAALSTTCLGALAVQIRRSDGGWRAYFLFVLERLYTALRFQVRTNRRCPFPATGGGLIVANHRSPLDPVLLWQNHHLRPEGTGRFRIISFMMASEYYEIHPVIGFVCRTMRSIKVDRKGKDMGPVREAVRILRDGGLVGIFPEGGINEGPGLRRADTGVAWLALTAQVPVFPVYIENTPVGKNMVEPFFMKQPVRLHYGEPIDLSAYRGQKKTPELLEEVTLRIMRSIGDLAGYDMSDYRCLKNGETNGSPPATA